MLTVNHELKVGVCLIKLSPMLTGNTKLSSFAVLQFAVFDFHSDNFPVFGKVFKFSGNHW